MIELFRILCKEIFLLLLTLIQFKTVSIWSLKQWSSIISKIHTYLFKDNGVNVLTEHVEKKPVAHLGLADDGIDHLSIDEAEANVEQVGSHARAKNDNEPVEQYQRRQKAQDEEPEPEEDVNLFQTKRNSKMET